MTVSDLDPTLMTADSGLADAANAQGYRVIDYKAWVMDDRAR